MDLGIIGLAKSGKTTVFNSLTRGHAETSAFSRGGSDPNVGVVKVPDSRLDQLVALDNPKKVTPAEVRYIDFAAIADTFSKGAGIKGVFLNEMGKVDALIHVVRAFTDPSIPHANDSIDPGRDIETINLELLYSDAAIVERRLERIAVTLKAAKPAEREAAAAEQEWLQELKVKLENGVPIREMTFNDAQQRVIANYSLLTAKPLLIIVNLGEEQLEEAGDIERSLQERLQRPNTEILTVCGKLEMELAQMEPQEADEFRADLGIKESGLTRVIQTSYSLLGFISFFTTGPDETRAWTIRRGTLAPQAAGKIHTDLEKGFIRAEVVPWDRLLSVGGWSEARKHGLLRSEGKSYEVQDGDVVNILFSR